jgi:hypothetical protein
MDRGPFGRWFVNPHLPVARPRNRYASGQLLRGASAPAQVGFARSFSADLQRQTLEDQGELLEDVRVLVGKAAAAALLQMGITNHPNSDPVPITRMGAATRRS